MPEPERSFAPTRWTLVLRAKGEDSAARAALSDLCAAYYAPVVAFLRHRLRTDDAAREQAHAFFARILEGRSLAGVKPALQATGESFEVSATATQLGMSPGAVKVAVHRLRARFRESVKRNRADRPRRERCR